ncbi:MAG: hypothetical protein Q7S18_01765 [bacterium]|nr:hypothetical protein [bacterium]
MKIISISGLDGSGKSTQINLLKDYLESQGKRVFYFHVIQFGIANKLTKIFNFCHPESRVTRDQRIPSENNKSVIKANKLQIWLRKVFLKIDLKRFKNLVKKLEKEGYDYILTDRYFYDSVVNIEYLENNKSNKSNPEAKLREFPKLSFGIAPYIAIYLQTDPETIMRRERKPDQGIEYLKNKKEIYDNYSVILNLKIINGNRLKEEIFEEIKNIA